MQCSGWMTTPTLFRKPGTSSRSRSRPGNLYDKAGIRREQAGGRAVQRRDSRIQLTLLRHVATPAPAPVIQRLAPKYPHLGLCGAPRSGQLQQFAASAGRTTWSQYPCKRVTRAAGSRCYGSRPGLSPGLFLALGSPKVPTAGNSARCIRVSCARRERDPPGVAAESRWTLSPETAGCFVRNQYLASKKPIRLANTSRWRRRSMGSIGRCVIAERCDGRTC